MPDDRNEPLSEQGLLTADADALVARWVRGAVPLGHGWCVWACGRVDRTYRVPALTSKDAGGRARRARLVISVLPMNRGAGGPLSVRAELRCLMGNFYGRWDTDEFMTLTDALGASLAVLRAEMRPRCAKRAAEAWSLAEVLGELTLMERPFRPGGRDER